MRALLPLALVGVALVAVAGCQYGLSRPGFEFRVCRPPVCLEPHLVDLPSRGPRSLPLEAPGFRSFEPTESVALPAPVPQLAVPRWRAAPAPVALDPCLVEALLRTLER